MYFVIIDLGQLHTRLRYSAGRQSVDLAGWLSEHGFEAADDGWYGTADSLNSLSCTEIRYSERCGMARRAIAV